MGLFISQRPSGTYNRIVQRTCPLYPIHQSEIILTGDILLTNRADTQFVGFRLRFLHQQLIALSKPIQSQLNGILLILQQSKRPTNLYQLRIQLLPFLIGKQSNPL
ncbi:hypothetical protein SDC9_30848 [bioreactor metagenome]|uniref:Uncharacterized protein n=1 Tax=bioreactor metagenome TaxID=1076179 RepID=A0A644V1V9_9ZZZZ